MYCIQFNACTKHVYSIQCMHIQSNACILLYQIYPVSELSPELSLIVAATGIMYQEACPPLSIIISYHLSRPIGLNIFYLL